MALTTTEKAQLAEILGIPFPDLVSAELALIAATDQETILKADLARYQVIRADYGRLNGKDGVEFDPDEERGDIKNRIIRLLNCSALVNEYRSSTNGLILRA